MGSMSSEERRALGMRAKEAAKSRQDTLRGSFQPTQPMTLADFYSARGAAYKAAQEATGEQFRREAGSGLHEAFKGLRAQEQAAAQEHQAAITSSGHALKAWHKPFAPGSDAEVEHKRQLVNRSLPVETEK